MLERLQKATSPLPHETVAAKRTDLLRLAARYGLTNVRLFGSTARRTDRPGSDVDLLVNAPPRTGLLTIAAFADEVEDLLKVSVDVVTEGGLRDGHPILEEAVPL